MHWFLIMVWIFCMRQHDPFRWDTVWLFSHNSNDYKVCIEKVLQIYCMFLYRLFHCCLIITQVANLPFCSFNFFMTPERLHHFCLMITLFAFKSSHIFHPYFSDCKICSRWACNFLIWAMIFLWWCYTSSWWMKRN